MICTVRDLEVMGLNPDQVELGVHSTFVKVVLEPKLSMASVSVLLRACALKSLLRKCASTFFLEAPDG